MLIGVHSSALKSVFTSLTTFDSGETGKPEVRAPKNKDRIELPDYLDNPKDTKYASQVHGSVGQGASQDKEVAQVQGLNKRFGRLKRAMGMLREKYTSHEEAESVKPRRGGFYTFLYGGRVNVDTFYDYKDNQL